MSSKGRGTVPQPHDQYYTPQNLALAALQTLRYKLPLFEPLTCLEPGCGCGVHLDCAQDVFPSIVYTAGVDIEFDVVDPSHEHIIIDFLEWQPETKFDLIVTNPPFSLTDEFIHKSRELLSKNGVMLFLQRYGFIASIDRRYGLWTEVALRETWICVPRPIFIRQSGGDSCEYAYYLMDDGCPQLPVILDWLDWEKDRRIRKRSK